MFFNKPEFIKWKISQWKKIRYNMYNTYKYVWSDADFWTPREAINHRRWMFQKNHRYCLITYSLWFCCRLWNAASSWISEWFYLFFNSFTVSTRDYGLQSVWKKSAFPFKSFQSKHSHPKAEKRPDLLSSCGSDDCVSQAFNHRIHLTFWTYSCFS